MRGRPGGLPGGGGGGGHGEGAALSALAAVGAGTWAWVWLAGQLTALLASGRWPAMSPLQSLGVVARLPGHLASPGVAWPAPMRPALPTALLDSVAVVLLAALLAVGASALRLRTALVAPRRAGPSSPARPAARVPGRSAVWAGGARWASGRDVRHLTVRRAVPGRLVLGRMGGRLVATELRHSLLVFGPTQSGKTSGLAVPAILEWEGPVVATSVKADLAAATLGWRSGRGTCLVFDPTATAGVGALAGWSPICEASDWSRAQRVAASMVDATPARAGLTDGAFWYAAAAKQLAPLLLAARCGALGMAEVLSWTDADEWEQPLELLKEAGQAGAAAALVACSAREDRIRSSVATTLDTVLSPFEDPGVVAATAGDDIHPDRLLDGANTLYLCGPSHEQARLQGLFAALVSSVVGAAVERATAAGTALDPPLLLVLDEAANIAPIRDLDALAATGAGLGIQLVTICQDLAQFTARYGAERARTIANNHRAKLALSGIADLATLDLLSGLAGEQAVREETLTADLRDGRRTRSSSVTFRRLAPADELRRITPGTGVAIYGHLPPMRVQLRPWFADRRLRARAGAGAS